MDGTTKRLKIADVIANMFRSVLALSPGMAAACSRTSRLCAASETALFRQCERSTMLLRASLPDL